MPSTPASQSFPLNRRSLALALCLIAVLAGVYWFTYSGRVLSTDELSLFDGVESLSRRGNTRVNLNFDYPRQVEFPVDDQVPSPLVDAELLQLTAASGLFRLAEILPGVGLAHMVWLLNVLMCAAAGGVFFLLARLLGHTERVAIGATLILGLGTMLWPYSKVFFREPLAMLLLLGATLCLQATVLLWGRRAAFGWLVGFTACVLLTLLTKEAMLLSLPIFAVMVLPRISVRGGWRRLGLVIVVGGGALGLVLVGLNLILSQIEVARTYDLLARLADISGKAAFIENALLAYLFSPGRSLIVHVPVLLLMVPGVGLLIRRRQWRAALLPVMAVATFVVGYAVARNELWYGGLGWGPRYMLPAVPLALLGVLPVLAAVARPGAPRWQRIGVIGIVALSVGVQLLGVLFRQDVYSNALGRAGVVPWLEGTWNPVYSPLVVVPGLIGQVPLDFAWAREGVDGFWQPLTALAAIAGGLAGLRFWRRPAHRERRAVALTLAAVLVGLAGGFYVGLRGIYHDPAYLGDREQLHALLGLLDERLQPEDIVVLTTPVYREFFMNYDRDPRGPVYTLRTAIGERLGPDQPPEVTNTNPDWLLEARISVFLLNLPEYTDRVWLVNDSGPFDLTRLRPVEWYMARHFFPVETAQSDETARLILFDVNADAPPEAALALPDHPVEADFGGEVRLLGLDLPAPRVRVGPFSGPDPARTAYAPGDIVPVSLLWQADQTPATDYNVGLFLLNEGGVVVERNGAPQGGFMPMDAWLPGAVVRDNYGLQLPADLSPGEYAIWVKVYDWRTQEPLTVSGSAAVEDDTAAYLTTIQVGVE